MSAMVGNVTRDRYDELVRMGWDWVATMSSAQWRLGDAAMEIEPMRSYGGANPSGKVDLFSVVGVRTFLPSRVRAVGGLGEPEDLPEPSKGVGSSSPACSARMARANS
jgi:hypothetical protein